MGSWGERNGNSSQSEGMYAHIFRVKGFWHLAGHKFSSLLRMQSGQVRIG